MSITRLYFNTVTAFLSVMTILLRSMPHQRSVIQITERSYGNPGTPGGRDSTEKLTKTANDLSKVLSNIHRQTSLKIDQKRLALLSNKRKIYPK